VNHQPAHLLLEHSPKEERKVVSWVGVDVLMVKMVRNIDMHTI
jgi:hypothetical protein